ncbi:MAG: response regulator [Chlorobi bacterium]|nr:response regulator [Chlorobiota bacterium]
MAKFLIVDDDEQTRKFLSILIKTTFRIEVATASNGKEALEVIPSIEPDFICLDITMPEMDGLQFIKEFKKLEKFSDSTIIIMSAVGDKSVIQQLLSEGIQYYILKPFDFNTTQDRLKKIVFPILEEMKKKQNKLKLKEE